MSLQTLISSEDLLAHVGDPDWAIVDCRFTLGDAERGKRDYVQAHIPGAVYAQLEDDLCSPHIPGVTGRHPLPPVEDLVSQFSEWGIGPGVQVVAYDDWPGASGAVAARLWWSLRWLGHQAVAVLDGGWDRWLQMSAPVKAGTETRPHRDFRPSPHPELIASVEEVDRLRTDPAYKLFDSRSADRYRGENETIDPVAGHIPGAINAPYAENVRPDGLFHSPNELRQRFRTLLGETPSQNAVFYCGSGVTAAHNLLALAHAGLGDARLYVGSWSEWITDPSKPVEKG